MSRIVIITFITQTFIKVKHSAQTDLVYKVNVAFITFFMAIIVVYNSKKKFIETPICFLYLN